ncbi:hypothetical protein NQ315_016077 [Exocentrus adspersus]|uniref:Uncharacterized protein n=1 Tax=Exocentrus adspersus TaxID=1586481 RepID=A0AAV8VL03_9CUCU|nr:hypothetical protein NQ315_016077 [Exocentrus adspersus]
MDQFKVVDNCCVKEFYEFISFNDLQLCNNVLNTYEQTLDQVLTSTFNACKIVVKSTQCPLVSEDLHHPALSVNITIKEIVNNSSVDLACERRKLKILIREAHNGYMQTLQASINSNNNSAFWSYINSQKGTNTETIMKLGDNVNIECKEVPNRFGEYFQSSAGFATEPAAQTPAKAQVYPGHSKTKEPVADRPLLRADVPSTRPGTDSEPVRKRVHVGASTLGVNPVVLLGFTLAVLRRYLSP